MKGLFVMGDSGGGSAGELALQRGEASCEHFSLSLNK